MSFKSGSTAPYAVPGASRVIHLSTGALAVTVEHSDLSLDQLCGFACRRNPRRAFLFVSNVLGRHVPVRPSVIRDSYRRLAAKIRPDLPGPVIFVGMAETAISLGQGVFEEYLRLTGRTDCLFLHSTRYRLSRPVALEFREEHSHAADHILYAPEGDSARQLFAAASSLVLVDDEASTGKTFLNLIDAFCSVNGKVGCAVGAVLCDWRGPSRRVAMEESLSLPFSMVSLLAGQYAFEPRKDAPPVSMPNVRGNGGLKDGLVRLDCGRQGVTTPLSLEPSRLPAVCQGERVLVLGTGEFAYLPILAAEELERRGAEVFCQSTTRSPVMPGGAIGATLVFRDNYEDGIPNFLYNARRQNYDRVIICTETPGSTLDGELVDALDAQVLECRS